MARKALVLKALKNPKYPSRAQTRCGICGRPKGYLRRFNMCRICFREYATKGEIPGVRKSSW